MIISSKASNQNILIRIVDDNDDPINSIAYDNLDLSISYRTTSSVGWTALTLVDGTIGTWVVSSFKFIENGLYQLSIPNASIVPYNLTYWKVSYLTTTVYDVIEATGSANLVNDTDLINAVRDSVWTRTQRSLTDPVQTLPSVPVFTLTIDDEEVQVVSSSLIYVHEQDVLLAFEVNTDLTAVLIELVIEESDGTDVLVIDDDDLTKTAEGFTITLPNELTATIGSFTWGVRRVSDQKFFGSGTFSVIYAPYKDSLDA